MQITCLPVVWLQRLLAARAVIPNSYNLFWPGIPTRVAHGGRASNLTINLSILDEETKTPKQNQTKPTEPTTQHRSGNPTVAVLETELVWREGSESGPRGGFMCRETKGRKRPWWLLLWNPHKFPALLSWGPKCSHLKLATAGFRVTFFLRPVGHTWELVVVLKTALTFYFTSGSACNKPSSLTQQTQSKGLLYTKHSAVFPRGAYIPGLTSQGAHARTGGSPMSNKVKMQSWSYETAKNF